MLRQDRYSVFSNQYSVKIISRKLAYRQAGTQRRKEIFSVFAARRTPHTARPFVTYRLPGFTLPIFIKIYTEFCHTLQQGPSLL